MKYVKNYMTWDYDTPPDMIIESLGISDLVKMESENIFNDIDNIPFLKKYSIFNTNVSVKIIYYNSPSIYAISSPSDIFIKVPHNYDKLDLHRILTHELNHVYEIKQRIDNDVKNGLEYKLTKNNMVLRNRYEDDFIQELIYMMYIGSKHEMGARVAETYTILMDVKSNDSDLLLSELKKTSAWKYCEDLNNFDINNYDINYDILIEYLTDINKNFNNVNFGIFDIPNDKKDCDVILNKWNKLFKKKHKNFKKKLIRMISEVIDDYNEIIGISD